MVQKNINLLKETLEELFISAMNNKGVRIKQNLFHQEMDYHKLHEFLELNYIICIKNKQHIELRYIGVN